MSLLLLLKPHYRTSVPMVRGGDFIPSEEAETALRKIREDEFKKTLKLRRDLELIIDGKLKIFRDGDIVSDDEYQLVLLMLMLD